MATYEESIEIAASPEAVYAEVSDLPGMGRFSPENTGGHWLKGATGPAVGARFKGTNAQGKDSWTTTARVVEASPPSSFAFEVTVGPVKVSRWSFQIEATESGSRVTETWLDRRSALIKRVGAKGTDDREGYTRHSIATTLSALKEYLER